MFAMEGLENHDKLWQSNGIDKTSICKSKMGHYQVSEEVARVARSKVTLSIDWHTVFKVLCHVR